MSHKQPEPKPGELWSSTLDYTLPPELLQDFSRQVRALADTVFGRDCDNDSPIAIYIIDRTRHEPWRFMRVPYAHKVKTDAESELRLLDLLANVRIATDALNSELRNRERKRYEEQHRTLPEDP